MKELKIDAIKRIKTIAVIVFGFSFFGSPSSAQVVAIYPVKTEGFTLNESEVIEMHRVAMQACFDAGLKCRGKGDTSENVAKERQLAGGRLTPANYVAECALTGKTEDRMNIGLSKGGITVYGGGGTTIKGIPVGAGTRIETHGINIGTSGMNLACQFSSTVDGTLVYSESAEKVSVSGELILIEHRSSNVKKLQGSFEKMFKHAKSEMKE